MAELFGPDPLIFSLIRHIATVLLQHDAWVNRVPSQRASTYATDRQMSVSPCRISAVVCQTCDLEKLYPLGLRLLIWKKKIRRGLLWILGVELKSYLQNTGPCPMSNRIAVHALWINKCPNPLCKWDLSQYEMGSSSFSWCVDIRHYEA